MKNVKTWNEILALWNSGKMLTAFIVSNFSFSGFGQTTTQDSSSEDSQMSCVTTLIVQL